MGLCLGAAGAAGAAGASAVWAEDPCQPIEGPWVIARWVREMTGLLRFTVLVGLTFSALGALARPDGRVRPESTPATWLPGAPPA